MTIDKIKEKKNRADINDIYNFIVPVHARNTAKNAMKDFITQLVAR